MQHHQLRLSTLSPVHIGAGDSMDPFSYFIASGNLYCLDQFNLVNDLSEIQRKQLDELIDNTGSDNNSEQTLIRLQRFFHDNRQALYGCVHTIRPLHQAIEGYYQNKLALQTKQHAQSKLTISEITKSAYKGTPYVPGSSLKGAIRTVLSNDLLQANDSWNSKSKNIEKHLYNYDNASSDPFKALRIGDFSMTEVIYPEVVFVSSISKKEDSPNPTMPTLVEVLPAGIIQAIQGDLVVNPNHLTEELTAETLQLSNLFKSLNRFYLPKLTKELSLYQRQQTSQYAYSDKKFAWAEKIHELIADLQSEFNNGKLALMRIGRYAGGEYKTWDKLRKIDVSPRGNRGVKKFAQSATTRWLCNPESKDRGGALPLGWILLSETNTEVPLAIKNFSQLSAIWAHKCQQSATELDTLKQDQQDRKLKQQQSKLAQEQKLKQKQEAEFQRQSLSTEDKIIHDLYQQLETDKQAKNHDSTQELRQLLNRAVQSAEQLSNSDYTDKVRQAYQDCINWWQINDKKNKKLKALRSKLNGL